MLPILTNTKDDPGHRDNYLDNCRKSQEMLKWKIQALARSVQKLLKFTKEEWQTGQNRYAHDLRSQRHEKMKWSWTDFGGFFSQIPKTESSWFSSNVTIIYILSFLVGFHNKDLWLLIYERMHIFLVASKDIILQ